MVKWEIKNRVREKIILVINRRSFSKLWGNVEGNSINEESRGWKTWILGLRIWRKIGSDAGC